jgi:hypothetical protein
MIILSRQGYQVADSAVSFFVESAIENSYASRIWGPDSDSHEEFYLLGYNAA